MSVINVCGSSDFRATSKDDVGIISDRHRNSQIKILGEFNAVPEKPFK